MTSNNKPLGRDSESIGAKPLKQVIAYLRDIGDVDAADSLQQVGAGGQGLFTNWGEEVWGHTGVILGYIAPDDAGDCSEIRNATTIEPDPTLKDTRIRISLDKFWVQRYPGRGKHRILLEFAGKNQIGGDPEEMRFVLTTEANDASSAGVSGTPIFLGASVGKNGISFEGKAVNVESGDDEELLSALGSGPFKQGLSLLTTAQPALKPFVGIAQSVVGAILRRSRNKQVQYFRLGLDFSPSRTAAKLREGSFVVIQGDQSTWSWNDVAWNPDGQQIVWRSDRRSIEYNYLIFRVSRYEGD